MVTVATTVRYQGERLVRGADGALYALRDDTCERVKQGLDSHKPDCHFSHGVLKSAHASDYGSAQVFVDPGDHASARVFVDPGDYRSAQVFVDQGDHASARVFVDPGDQTPA